MPDEAGMSPGSSAGADHLLDPERYLVLMRDLDATRTAVTEAGQPCSAILKSTYALQAVIQFLLADPGAHEMNLVAPLLELEAALHDRMQGARPAFFEIEGLNKTNPTNLHVDFIRGQIVAALNTVIKAGMKPGEATMWINLEMRDLGFPAEMMKAAKWREKVSDGTAPQNQKLAAKEILKDQATAIALGVPEAKLAARSLLQLARQHNFPSSPRNHGRRT